MEISYLKQITCYFKSALEILFIFQFLCLIQLRGKIGIISNLCSGEFKRLSVELTISAFSVGEGGWIYICFIIIH